MATPHHFLDKAVPHYCWPGCLCLSGLIPKAEMYSTSGGMCARTGAESGIQWVSGSTSLAASKLAARRNPAQASAEAEPASSPDAHPG